MQRNRVQGHPPAVRIPLGQRQQGDYTQSAPDTEAPAHGAGRGGTTGMGKMIVQGKALGIQDTEGGTENLEREMFRAGSQCGSD